MSSPVEITVADEMHPGLIACDSSDPLFEAARAMVRHRVHAVVVRSDDGPSFLSDHDLLQALQADPAAGGRPVGEIAATDPLTISPGETVREAARLMGEHEISHLFVLESGADEPAGIVSSLDLARSLLRGAEPTALSIVVGHDGSKRGSDAIALAAVLGAGRAAVTAVIAVPFPPQTVGDPPIHAGAGARDWNELCADLRARGRELLEAEAWPGLGAIDVSTHVLLDDSAGRALTLLCEAEQPDLLILGSSHRGPLGRVLLGGTAERLLSGAPCSVAVAPAGYAGSPAERLERVGVGFDGSESSAQALSLGARLALDHGARLEVTAVARPMTQLEAPLEAIDVLAGAGLVDHSTERLRSGISESLAGQPERLEAEVQIVHGDPVTELMRRSASGLDLLVVGSRGYGPLRRALLGSVSTRLVRHCECPLIVAA